jgi:hypothetical protein
MSDDELARVGIAVCAALDMQEKKDREMSGCCF